MWGYELGIFMRHCGLDEAYQSCEKLINAIRNVQFFLKDTNYLVCVGVGLSVVIEITEIAVIDGLSLDITTPAPLWELF